MNTDRFELLITRASARSLDLKQLAGEATKIIPFCSRKRRELMEDLYGAPMRETVISKQTRVTRKAYYTHAELATSLSFAKVNGSPLLAARYALMFDPSARDPLYRALRAKVAVSAEKEEWPAKIQGLREPLHHYHDELTDLVLEVDWLKPLFLLAQERHKVNLYAIRLDVSDDIWHSQCAPYFKRIGGVLEGWLMQARRAIENKLAQELHRRPVANQRLTA